jgi:hypothetical protein
MNEATFEVHSVKKEAEIRCKLYVLERNTMRSPEICVRPARVIVDLQFPQLLCSTDCGSLYQNHGTNM